MQLSIIQEPDARLHEVAEPIAATDFHTEHLERWIRDLEETFHFADNCIGLAAPQLGIAFRLIIVDVTDRHSDTYLMINPVITQESEELQLVQDGCMSVELGKKHAQTKRPKRITVCWITKELRVKRQKFSGTIAACIHHEIDHLNGVLFMDRYFRGSQHAVL